MIACYLLCMNTCAKTTKLHKGYVDIDNMLFDSINKSRIYLYTKDTFVINILFVGPGNWLIQITEIRYVTVMYSVIYHITQHN